MTNKKALYESIMSKVSKEVKRSLALNESSDGWYNEDMDELERVLSDIYNLQYEIKNCIKGAYTNCHTYDELADYIANLADELSYAAETVRGIQEPYDEYEDEDYPDE